VYIGVAWAAAALWASQSCPDDVRGFLAAAWPNAALCHQELQRAERFCSVALVAQARSGSIHASGHDFLQAGETFHYKDVEKSS
jgi:hypothetical protein